MKSFGNGLILRCLEESDRDCLLEHVKNVFEDGMALLTRQLCDYYPGFSLQDNFVVVDTQKENKIAAWLCLLRKTCFFEGIEIPYGQMDMVGTQREYRNRGLIRQLSKMLEERAIEYDIPFLVVLGIPYFYKILGYEHAITLEGSIRVPTETIAPLQKKEEETYLIQRVCDLNSFKTYLRIRAKRNAHLDLYQQLQKFSFHFYNRPNLEESDEIRHFYLVKKNAKIIGNFYLVIRFGYFRVRELYVEEMAAIPAILRFAKRLAKKCDLPLTIIKPAQDELIPYLEQLAGTRLADPYAWYVKIPSIKKFVEQLAPVLEKRLQRSVYQGLDAIINISYYRAGIKLTFQKGKLRSVTELGIKDLGTVSQSFDLYIPPNHLIQLLLGYKTIDKLELFTLDVTCAGSKKHLLDTLFPLVKASLTPTI